MEMKKENKADRSTFLVFGFVFLVFAVLLSSAQFLKGFSRWGMMS